MKLTRAEKAVLILAAVFAALLAGYHFGTGSQDGSFTISVENKYASENSSVYQTSGPVSAAPNTAAPAAEKAGGRVNINTAGADELCSLPGIGEILAGRIVAYRGEHGDFKSLDDIMNVNGIGEAKFSAILDMITLSD